MKKISKIGIVSSVILIVNYLEVGLGDLIFSNSKLLYHLNETVFRVIFMLGIIGFYYSISKYFEKNGNKSLTKYLNALILIKILSFGLKLIQYFVGVIPNIMMFLMPLIYLISIVLFVILGINILKIKNERYLNLKSLKNFVISMFVAFILVFILTFLLTFTNRIELSNLSFLIYTIPYVFGLTFFLKLTRKD